MENEKIINAAKQISDLCREQGSCKECPFYINENFICLFIHRNLPENWKFDKLTKKKDTTENVSVVEDDKKWSEFRDFMYQLHEMRNEGCNGCEEPPTTCRKCMQDYYWLNIKHYL